ncbi:hypothetical protein HDU93_009647 [Gonapodya sp. JEL0774]|nr:hypothetical protein HDU93_009647 [Gonapodya sp. JEL0774]
MKDSYICDVIPFRSNQSVLEDYLNPYGGIRIGKLLEDLDAFSGAVAYKHLGGLGGADLPTLVTASVERLDMVGHVTPEYDVKLSGNVTWVGRSSIEISVRLDSLDDQGNTLEPVLLTRFVMVARNATTGKASPVNPLLLETDEERKVFAEGEAHKSSRLLLSRTDVFKTPPTPDESALVHKLCLEGAGYGDTGEVDAGGEGGAAAGQGVRRRTVKMKDTVMESVKVTYPSDR